MPSDTPPDYDWSSITLDELLDRDAATICGCGARQERPGAATCDRCAEALAALNRSPQRAALVGINRHLKG